MGRRKISKTVAQVAKQKRVAYDRLNDRRRARYAADKPYRQACKTASRQTARRTSSNSNPQMDRQLVCKSGLSGLSMVANTRRLIRRGTVTDLKVQSLTSAELAPLIGLSHVVMLHKWHRAGKFPRPKLLALVGRTHAAVYTKAEARELVKIMLEHYKFKSYLYKTDQNTIDMLHEVMGG